MGLLSTTISRRLFVRIFLAAKLLRQNFEIKKRKALLIFPPLTTRSGTAHSFALFCLLAWLPSALAQEDVAETKANATIDTTPISEPAITAQDRAHWAFHPIRRPELPSIQNPKFKIQNSID